MQLHLILETESKQCTKCGRTKPLTDFYKDRGHRDGLFQWCKPCANKSANDHRERAKQNDPTFLAKRSAAVQLYKQRKKGNVPDFTSKTKWQIPVTGNNAHQRYVKKRRMIAIEFIRFIKAAIGCQVCGESTPECLDFHHINPETKSYTIARMHHKTLNLDEVSKEIEKCACVCSNCHRKIHHGIIPTDYLKSVTRLEIEKTVRAFEVIH